MTDSNLRLTVVPTPGAFDVLDVFLDGNGLIDASELSAVRLPRPPDPHRGLVVNGRAPIWLYGRLVDLCRDAAWTATTDPRLGAVVVATRVPEAMPVGAILPPERLRPWLPRHASVAPARPEAAAPAGKVVAFLGPPHSGKTVLVGALRQALRATLTAAPYQRDVFVLRACPDGEGDWYADAADDARTLRYKNRFDDAFVHRVCEQLDALRREKTLLLVDCGGRIDRKNQAILNRCTHAIVVSSREDAFAEWRGALRASETTLLAEVESSLEPASEAAGPRFRIGPLDRARVAEVVVPPSLLTALLG